MLIVALAALTVGLAGALWFALRGRTGDKAPASYMGLYTSWGLPYVM